MEENDTVSSALAKLAEVEEKVEGLHEEQVCFGYYLQSDCTIEPPIKDPFK